MDVQLITDDAAKKVSLMLIRCPLLMLVCGFLYFMLMAAAGMAKEQEKDSAPGAQTLFPPQLPGDVELFNPMSGLYTSLSQNPSKLNLQCLNAKFQTAAPLTMLSDEYGRLSWHSLEPREGQYDFSIIDKVLEPCLSSQDQCSPQRPQQSLCLPRGVRFSFRIMAFDSQMHGNTNVTTGSDGHPVYSDIPAYLMSGEGHKDARRPYTSFAHGWLLPVDPRDTAKGNYFVPDWNDPYLLQRSEALLSALGKRYDGDPRIGWVDVGLYGNWGEWHTQGLPDAADYTRGIPYASSSPYYCLNTQAYLSNTGKPGAYQSGTAATKEFIVDAHVRAFPKTQLVMMTGDGDALCHALKLPNSETHIGLRRDSLGSGAAPWFWQFPYEKPGCDTESDVNMILDRWKTAPFVTEAAMQGASSANPCRTFETDRATGSHYINEEVLRFHIAAIKNQSCTGIWDHLPVSQQQAFLQAGLHSGYRFAPVEVNISGFPKARSGDRGISIQTHWANTGVTPAYNAWSVEFSLWTYDSPTAKRQEVARMTSQVDLRRVLPTGSSPAVVDDVFELQHELAPARYALKVRVFDPNSYLNPMHLALQNETPEGYYPLGSVAIPDSRTH